MVPSFSGVVSCRVVSCREESSLVYSCGFRVVFVFTVCLPSSRPGFCGSQCVWGPSQRVPNGDCNPVPGPPGALLSRTSHPRARLSAGAFTVCAVCARLEVGGEKSRGKRPAPRFWYLAAGSPSPVTFAWTRVTVRGPFRSGPKSPLGLPWGRSASLVLSSFLLRSRRPPPPDVEFSVERLLSALPVPPVAFRARGL